MRSAMRSTRFPMILEIWSELKSGWINFISLSRKYGETEEEMIAYLENAQKELDEIAFSESGQKRSMESGGIARKIKALAVTLSEVRRQSGELHQSRWRRTGLSRYAARTFRPP